MLAVSLFDTSGIMLRDWALAGFDTLAVDLEGSDYVDRYKVRHTRGDALDVWRNGTADGASIIFGFPPCTDLAISGAGYWKKKGPKVREDAMRLVYVTPSLGLRLGIPWMIENPRSVITSEWREADYRFNPCDYGGYLPEDDVSEEPFIPNRDAYNKLTCIWAGGGFIMPRKKRIPPEAHKPETFTHMGGGHPERQYIRALTPRGFAEAVFLANVDSVRAKVSTRLTDAT
jgi:hypothetical protein